MDPNSNEYNSDNNIPEQMYNYNSSSNIDYQKFYSSVSENVYQSQPQRSPMNPSMGYFLPNHSPQMNSPYHTTNSYTSQIGYSNNPGYGMDKPWTRAMKDPSLIQRGTEIFVGNLSMETFENDIYEAFRDCGEVIDIRLHKNVQTKKCYAFVRFMNKEMLRGAMNKNLTNLKGRKMKITKSNENSTIFIGNIRKNWSNSDVEIKVKRIFHNCEKIEHFVDPNNPTKNRGFCFVVFKNRNEAIKALNYVASKGGINIDGVPLTCDWADVVDEDDSNSKQIFVSGLDESIEESTVREVFSAFGNIAEIVMSKMHKTSKRKDLAFVTFTTHEEAKRAADNYKLQYSSYQGEYDQRRISPLGENVTVSLAFSQQAMQAKKKVKETRKTPVHNLPSGAHMSNIGNMSNMSNIGNISNMNHPKSGVHVPIGGYMPNISPSMPHSMSQSIPQSIPSISANIPQSISGGPKIPAGLNNIHGIPGYPNQMMNMPTPMMTSSILPSTSIPGQTPSNINNPNLNSTAMLAMMNIINMNKNNMNISPTLMSQMMAACFESIINQNASGSSPNPTSSSNPQHNSPTLTQNLNSLNPSLNTSSLTPLNPSNQNISSGPKLIHKRLKINKKKRLSRLNKTNPSI